MMGLFLEKVVRSFCSKSAEPYLYASLDQFAGGYTKPKGTKQMPSLCCSSQEMWKSAPMHHTCDASSFANTWHDYHILLLKSINTYTNAPTHSHWIR